MNEIFEYDVFLSFVSTDEEIVKPIWQELCLSGLRVFWSDATLKNKLGESWFEIIQSSLERSRHFVLICSKASMTSEWVKREYKAFYNHCYKPGIRRLIPVLVGDYKVSDLPLFLREVEACELDQNLTKEIIRILGGTDIEELKTELLFKEEENNELRKTLENLESRLNVIEDDKSKLEKQLLAYNSETQHMKPQLNSSITNKPDEEIFNAVVDAKKETVEKDQRDSPQRIISSIKIYVGGSHVQPVLESDATSIFAQHLSRTFNEKKFRWCLKQSSDTTKNVEDRLRFLVIALEYGKRHRQKCDPEILENTFYINDAIIIEHIMIKYLANSPKRALVLKCFKEWSLIDAKYHTQFYILNYLDSVSTNEAIEPLLNIAQV